MSAIERWYDDELVTSKYRPAPVSGSRKGLVKAMNPDTEPTISETVTPAGNGIRRSDSMLSHSVVQTIPVRFPAQRPMGNALRVLRRVLKQGRSVVRRPRAPEFAHSSIERELSAFLEQFSTGAVRCEVSVAGHPKNLKPAIRDQINLIGRQALISAMLHSEATCIEVEVEYLPRRLRVVVRDNGRGIDPQVPRTQGDARSGFAGMRDRAESIGAKLTIWSRPGVGTEVEISVSSLAFANACA